MHQILKTAKYSRKVCIYSNHHHSKPTRTSYNLNMVLRGFSSTMHHT
jgi:hypothetical protein